jgi:hypothetical protein
MKKVALASACVALAVAPQVVVSSLNQAANAHQVICRNDPQLPFYNSNPAPGRANIEAATIIDCTPTAPDAQRTEVQVQIYDPDAWRDKGTPYISYSNAQLHRVYDTTSCYQGQYHLWRTKAKHKGTHGNSVEKTKVSERKILYCPI